MQIIVICAWCGKFIRFREAPGDKPPKLPISHGICPACKDKLDEEIRFTTEPTKVSLVGINENLFGRAHEKNPPQLETALHRVLMACQMIPPEPFSSVRYEQLQRLKLRRDRKGKLLEKPIEPALEYQLPLIKEE